MLTSTDIVSIDQLGREINIPANPSKIISTVPSISELLFDLELNEKFIGITKFCVNPSSLLQTNTAIGGTKNLNLPNIEKLDPHLIIANKEENNQEQIEQLSQKYPVWISDVNNLNSALEMILEIGRITSSIEKAEIICTNINLEFKRLRNFIIEKKVVNQPTVYFIWNKPFMLAGADTFIHDLMHKCGIENSIKLNRYPTLTISELKKLNVKNVLLSSEPFPFKQKHISMFKSIFPNAKIILVDGEMFSWYGSRLIKAPGYFISLLEQII